MAALPYPALHATHGGIWIAWPEGGVEAVGRGQAIARAAETPMIMLNAPLVGNRLGYPDLSGLDLLELFAFVHPARFAVPTPRGVAHALGLAEPEGDGQAAAFLREAAARLLDTLAGDWPERGGAWASAQALWRLRWPWAGAIAERLPRPERDEPWLFSKLPEWEESGGRAQPRPIRLDLADTSDRLDRLVGENAEVRTGQRDYAAAAAAVFSPRAVEDQPNLLLAEAGTGIGKTLGYLAPASLWAEQADGAVWISTYTKALQRQLDRESVRLFPDPAERRRRIVIRKGRENYLCLLNLEDALQGGFAGRAAILAQLVARWAAYSKDGDMVGGDLPGWLTSLFRRAGAAALTDRRGECVYAGCPHYRRCFIERSARASHDADLVIANHALVMVNAARGRDGGQPPTRIVFDEGHHLFDAADSTFAAAFTGQEAIELRRWIVGPEGKTRGRRRGLAARLMDVASYDEAGALALDAAVQMAARAAGRRLAAADRRGHAARSGRIPARRGARHRLCPRHRPGCGLRPGDRAGRARPRSGRGGGAGGRGAGAAAAAAGRARQKARSGARGRARLARRSGPRAGRGRGRRPRLAGADAAGAGSRCAARIGGPADPDFVDWLAVERVEGREYDVGLHRHWLDPTRPLAEAVLKPAHGVLVTSATLRGGGAEWANAEARTGAGHLGRAADRFEAASPFDYAANSEVLVVTDVRKGDLPALAGAYARLIEAAGGGTLGPVHRDPAAEGGPCADRRPPRPRRPAALRPACRPDRYRHAGRHLPRRSARLPARHRCLARRRRRARPFAAAGRDGGRALAAADGAPRGAPGERRRLGL